MPTTKEPSEWIKAGIGAFMGLLSISVVGLFMFIREVDAQNSKQETVNAVQNEKIQKMERMFDRVIGAIEKNTEAYNNLRVVITDLKRMK